MKSLILATGNPHKVEEFSRYFSKQDLEILPAPRKVLVDEDGQTYSENAYKKASEYSKALGGPCLADDSGIEVAALPGDLGVFSARFGGDGLSDKERCLLLLERMKDKKEREAFFTCMLCFYLSSNEVFFFEGRCKGRIALPHEMDRDTLDAFGYDPLFIPEGEKRPWSQMSDLKEEISHRSKALKEFKRFFLSKYSRSS